MRIVHQSPHGLNMEKSSMLAQAINKYVKVAITGSFHLAIVCMTTLWAHDTMAQGNKERVLLLVFDGGNGILWCNDHPGVCHDDSWGLSANYEGLKDRGGATQIANTLRKAGYNVDDRYYSSYWASHYTPASATPVDGVLEAIETIDNAPSRTCIIAIGASEGGMWTRLIAHAVPQLDVLVDFDVMCAGWQGFQKEFDTLDPLKQIALHSRLGDLVYANPCNRPNVIPSNVDKNLEVRTSVFFRGVPIQTQPVEALLTDINHNHRFDGSENGIWHFVERTESHGTLLSKDDPSILWTSAMLLYVLQ